MPDPQTVAPVPGPDANQTNMNPMAMNPTNMNPMNVNPMNMNPANMNHMNENPNFVTPMNANPMNPDGMNANMIAAPGTNYASFDQNMSGVSFSALHLSLIMRNPLFEFFLT